MYEGAWVRIRLGHALMTVMGAFAFFVVVSVYYYDSTLVNGSLWKVEKAIEFAAKTTRIVRQTLFGCSGATFQALH